MMHDCLTKKGNTMEEATDACVPRYISEKRRDFRKVLRSVSPENDMYSAYSLDSDREECRSYIVEVCPMYHKKQLTNLNLLSQ